jgi:hypothetical protein
MKRHRLIALGLAIGLVLLFFAAPNLFWAGLLLIPALLAIAVPRRGLILWVCFVVVAAVLYTCSLSGGHYEEDQLLFFMAVFLLLPGLFIPLAIAVGVRVHVLEPGEWGT